ncbi:MAG: SctK family type III secretion system sorting platform protein, partial [Puniceicoccales bacterium]|nr:SctK family type III secretion system sorting platform protein [Puniceicoccales bacterium]
MAIGIESLKNVIATDFQYFKNWYDFYFNVEKYLPDREFEKVFSVYDKSIFSILLTSGCTQTDIRKNLLKILGLKDSVDYDVCTKPVKLVIDNKDRLTRTMNVAGAIFHHKDIIKIISKNELNALTEFIGQDIYTFIIKRGMIL